MKIAKCALLTLLLAIALVAGCSKSDSTTPSADSGAKPPTTNVGPAGTPGAGPTTGQPAPAKANVQ